MASTTTFGDFPGVRVQTVGNAVTGVVVGRRQKLVLFGQGDDGGSADENVVETFQTRRDPARKFGGDSDLAEAIEQAFGNGAPLDLIRGIRVPEVDVTGESVVGVSDFQLDNAPVDPDSVTVEDVVDGTTMDVVISHADGESAGSTLAPPSNANTAVVDPNTGAVVTDSSSDYAVDYTYLDYEDAFQTNADALAPGETGVMCAVADSHDVSVALSGTVNSMRGEYRMAVGVTGAQPNTDTAEGHAGLDPSNYEDAVDNDAMFLVGPARKEGGGYLLGAAAGEMSGAALEESVYNTALTVSGARQRLAPSELDTLAGEQVIPVEYQGAVRLVRNRSTSSEDGYERDYFVRRIVDQSILIAREIGSSIVGRINDADTRDTAENQVFAELEGLAGSGLIEPNGDETNFFVDFYEDGQQTVGVDLGITPNGIVKRVDTTINIAV